MARLSWAGLCLNGLGLPGLFLLGIVALPGCSGPTVVWDGSAYPAPDGETRAVVLWVRFLDDTEVYSEPVTAAARGWANPDRLPTLAASVLSESVRRPRGLTEYFLSQSQGTFRLTGTSYPRVLVTAQPEVAYRARNGTLDQAALTRELLAGITQEGRLDLARFDGDNDGFLDYVFIVIRRTRLVKLYPTHASGVSDLGYTSPEPEFGKRRDLQVDRNASGSYVRYDDSGNIFPEIDLVRLMAHEIGHDLWRDWVHLRSVTPLAGVPPFAERPVGYALMAGNGDARGDETISAFERAQLNWISCTPLTRDTTVVVEDLYSSRSDNCFTMEGPVHPPGVTSRTLYLSNRQRIGPFDRLLHESAPIARSDQGLMDTGLLVMATEPGGRVGPVPADGSLTLASESDAYRGDLFQAGQRLTPWTRPNSSGYLLYPAEVPSPSPHLFQGIHVGAMTGTGGLTLRYRADERLAAELLDGDIVPDLPDLVFTRVARVTGSVTIEGNAHFTDGLILEPGAGLTVSGTATVSRLSLSNSAMLTVLGTLAVEQLDLGPSNRVEVGPDGVISGSAAGTMLNNR